ncbi:di-trans,poly-cis-decaprenylcistransferase [Candidatus Woesearchaeota archaeon]|nr:di-trans,poly-cis-decaprenylcistransferase [Candidatus Woesearchaeota archaeon]
MGEGLHIGIILDGNRRFAKKKKMAEWRGHSYGAKKVMRLLDWCAELKVRELTLYSFSVENFKRPEKEKAEIFKLFRRHMKRLEKEEKFRKNGIKIRFAGRIGMFPSDITENMKRLMEKTKDNKGLVLNFAMGYGGRAEIVDAVRKICRMVKEGKIDVESVDEQTITSNLYIEDEPELIIRPGGEKRVSNFLIWQGYYSEWHFTDKLWPEFTKKDIKDAIDDFNRRERRFGE